MEREHNENLSLVKKKNIYTYSSEDPNLKYL